MFIQSEIDTLVYWICERDRVRRLKESGTPKPWTKDSLLQNYRWCNVRRMDDRVSRWLVDRWYPGTRGANLELLSAVLARSINWPESLEAAIDAFPSVSEIQKRLHFRKNAGKKIFTGAYVVPGVQGQDKINSILILAGEVNKRGSEAKAFNSMFETWKWLLEFKGLGRFLAGQVVADLAFLDYGSQWPDKMSWAPVGPGSARGANRLLGKPKNTSITQKDFEEILGSVIDTVRPKIEAIWEDRQLVAMDIQNCLCEYDKYRRLTLGEGKVRASYDGRGQQGELL